MQSFTPNILSNDITKPLSLTSQDGFLHIPVISGNGPPQLPPTNTNYPIVFNPGLSKIYFYDKDHTVLNSNGEVENRPQWRSLPKQGKDGVDGKSFNWKGSWGPEENYELNDVVIFGNSAYICINSHENSTEMEAPNNINYWDIFTTAPFNWRFRGVYRSRTDYIVGDIIGIQINTGSVPKYASYICIDNYTSPNTVNSPVQGGIDINYDHWRQIYRDGFDGQRGERGPTGDDGEDGTRGLQGIQGPPGPPGPQGPQGDTGPQGPQVNGEPGAQGPQGDTGLPPEHRWTNGENLAFKNPDGSWGTSVSLRGPQGNRGPRGHNGNDGSNGSQGLPGIQGNRGTHWRVGAEDPSFENGDREGDFYLKTDGYIWKYTDEWRSTNQRLNIGSSDISLRRLSNTNYDTISRVLTLNYTNGESDTHVIEIESDGGEVNSDFFWIDNNPTNQSIMPPNESGKNDMVISACADKEDVASIHVRNYNSDATFLHKGYIRFGTTEAYAKDSSVYYRDDSTDNLEDTDNDPNPNQKVDICFQEENDVIKVLVRSQSNSNGWFSIGTLSP